MARQARRPRQVSDVILAILRSENRPMTAAEIHRTVEEHLGERVAPSTVRSYLQREHEGLRRVDRGRYMTGATSTPSHTPYGDRDLW